MSSRLFIFVFCCFSMYSVNAQIKGGVKIGLNFSNIKGPSELDPSGAKLEQTDSYTGFLIGPSFSYPITDNFGLRADFLYAKKGMKYTYNGPYARVFTLDNNFGDVPTTGTSKVALSVSNTSLDIPIMAYGRLGKLELSGGVYASLLFIKVADGTMEYKWKNNDGSDGVINPVLGYNYKRDKFGESDNSTTEQAYFNAAKTRTATLPQRLGAYFDDTQDRGSLYNTFDYGVIGGASYFVNRSLFIGARLQYGLSDLTNNNADVTRSARNTDGSAILRNDKDHNFTIQAVVGFSL